jgi:hypothetical protein
MLEMASVQKPMFFGFTTVLTMFSFRSVVPKTPASIVLAPLLVSNSYITLSPKLFSWR